MRSRLTVLLGVLAAMFLLASGCDGTERGGEPGAASLEDLDAAVRPAVRALLDAPGIEATSLTFGEGDEPRFTRWMDYRSNGDFALVIFTQLVDGDGVNVTAATVIGGQQYAARMNPTDDQPWEALGPLPVTTEGFDLPIGIDLERIVGGSILEDVAGVPAAGLDVTSLRTADGVTIGTLTAPAFGTTITQRWRVDPDGVLVAYSIESVEGDLIGGAFTKAEFEFTALSQPEPIAPPELGTPLDLDVLGTPDGLTLPG